MSGDSLVAIWIKSPSFVNNPNAFVNNILNADLSVSDVDDLFVVNIFPDVVAVIGVDQCLCDCDGEAQTQLNWSGSAIPFVISVHIRCCVQ